MNASAATTIKADRLHWIKYNPNEWQGRYGELTDEEYGLFHRIIARLWATPGNRLTTEDLLIGLRVKPNSKRARLLQGLIGYALQVDGDGLLFVSAIDDAFADATRRSKAGSTAANARWPGTKVDEEMTPSISPEVCPTPNPADF